MPNIDAFDRSPNGLNDRKVSTMHAVPQNTRSFFEYIWSFVHVSLNATLRVPFLPRAQQNYELVQSLSPGDYRVGISLYTSTNRYVRNLTSSWQRREEEQGACTDEGRVTAKWKQGEEGWKE